MELNRFNNQEKDERSSGGFGSRRKKSRAYLDDFHRDLTGKYTYDGPMYSYVSEKPRKKLLLQLWGLCALMMVVTIAVGLVPAPGVSVCAYVVLPYAAALVAACSVLWALGEMSTGKDPMREYVYDATVKKLPLRAVLTAVFSAIAFVGEVVYLILNAVGGTRLWYAALVLVLMAGMAASALLLRKTLLAAEWKMTRERGETARAEAEESC